MVQVGRDIFAMSCVACHGDRGRGDGTVGATLSPRRAPQPRNFTGSEFKFRSTPSGQLPTTADLFRTITEGISASGGPLTFGLRRYRIMPSFRYMPEEQRLELLEYVKSLNPAFWERREVQIVNVPPVPLWTPERAARGRQLYADAAVLAAIGSMVGLLLPRRVAARAGGRSASRGPGDRASQAQLDTPSPPSGQDR
jgi:cytochrome c oxidase cbb3-type subunit 2